MSVVLSTSLDVDADHRIVLLDSDPITFDAFRHEQIVADSSRGLALAPDAPGLLGICPAREIDAKIDLEFRDDAPPEDGLEGYDAVFDTAMDVSTGRLGAYNMLDQLDFVTVVDVPAGTYRVRVYFSGRDTVDDDGIAGDDRYRFAFWPTDTPGVLGDRGPRVLKALPGPA